MDLAANLTLGWQVAAAAGRIGSDRIGASFGRGLPALSWFQKSTPFTSLCANQSER